MACSSLPPSSSVSCFCGGSSLLSRNVLRKVACSSIHGNLRLSRFLCSSVQRPNPRGPASPAAIAINDRRRICTLSSSLLRHDMQTPQGQSLLAMASDRLPLSLISQAACEQLEELLTAASPSSSYSSSSSSSCASRADSRKETLHRRIEEVQERERSKALQEIIYALVASKLLYAILPRPQEHASHSEPTPATSELFTGQQDTLLMHQLHLYHGLDDRLQALHSSDIQRLTKRHVAMVIYGKGCTGVTRVPLVPNAYTHVDKFEMGKMYAASVMHGYFLARVHQRFQLDRMFLSKASSSSGGSLQTDFQAPSFEAYMDFQDAGTLHQLASLSSFYTLAVIEHHCTALFGDRPSHIHRNPFPFSDADTTISIHLSFVRSLIYQALAFGALLWDVEHNFAPLYPHLCTE